MYLISSKQRPVREMSMNRTRFQEHEDNRQSMKIALTKIASHEGTHWTQYIISLPNHGLGPNLHSHRDYFWKISCFKTSLFLSSIYTPDTFN